MPQQGIDVDALVGQQPVHLLDRMLGQPPARQRKTLADQADRQRRGLDRPRRQPRPKTSPFGVQVVAKQRVEEVVDTVKRQWLTHRHGIWSQRRMTWSCKRASTRRGRCRRK